jgi:DedD protein
MDSRAKQRLTGAVILVALFVLLVPELLTGPRDPAGDAPSEEGMRRYTIDLDAPASGTQPVAPADPAPAVSLPPVAESSRDVRAAPGEAAQPEANTPAPATSAPQVSAPAPSVATPMTASPQAVASAPAATAPKPATNPAPVTTAVRAEPPKPAPASTAAATNPRGGFAVQLGSFVSKENAERLVRDMNGKGFNAFLAPPITTGGRELWRVRVGPTRDRAGAEALATQLRRIGQQGSIVSIS